MSKNNPVNSICLVSTFHDKNGKVSIFFLEKHINTIKKLLNYVSLVITDTTSKTIQNFLDQNRIKYIVTTAGFGSQSRNLSLKNGLQAPCKYYFYIDLDRLLYWLEKFPSELKQTIKQIKTLGENDYLVIGRTNKAWMNHPKAQQIPEEKTNRAISYEIKKDVDVTPGCRAFGKKIAESIAEKATGIQSGVSDIEWLMIAYIYEKANIKSIRVNGLSYETKLIFGESRANEFQGEYGYSRNQIADETIKMIDKVKKKFFQNKKF